MLKEQNRLLTQVRCGEGVGRDQGPGGLTGLLLPRR